MAYYMAVRLSSMLCQNFLTQRKPFSGCDFFPYSFRKFIQSQARSHALPLRLDADL